MRKRGQRFAENEPPRRRRQHGGVPRTLDYVARGLENDDPAEWAAKSAALHEVATLVSKIFKGAVSGDRHFGHMLAELTVFLQKKQPDLEARNATFRKHYAQLES